MKCTLVLLLAAVGLSSGIQLQGRWKENAAGRVGLNDFLYEIGMNWFKRLYVRTVSWSNEENIYQTGDKFKIYGYSGPKATVFSQEFVADNQTLTTVDMGELGGVMHARAFVDERDRLVVKMMEKRNEIRQGEEEQKKSSEKVKLEVIRTRKEGSRELLVQTRHFPSGSVLTSKYLKQG